jgi:hypothetical protein
LLNANRVDSGRPLVLPARPPGCHRRIQHRQLRGILRAVRRAFAHDDSFERQHLDAHAIEIVLTRASEFEIERFEPRGADARSAGVRASSNTGQTSAQPFGGWKGETPKGVVAIAGIDARIGGSDGLSFAPERFALNQPGALLPGQFFAVWLTCAHGNP